MMPQLGINISGVNNTPRQAPVKSRLYNFPADLWDALTGRPLPLVLPERLKIMGISIPTSSPDVTLIREKSNFMLAWVACPLE